MLLVIDSGNTNTVFAVYKNEKKLGKWRTSKDVNRTADEYGIWLIQIMTLAKIDYTLIKQAIISSVVPAMMFSLRDLCNRYFTCDPLVIGESIVDIGIEILVDNPEEVGADRIVNTAGASHHYNGDLIVIDFGTATTFDVIDKNKKYLGGVICPGINLSMEALYNAAAKLPRVAIITPQKVIGTNTISSMQSGLFWGYISLIEGIIARIKHEFGKSMIVIATGGLACIFIGHTKEIQYLDIDLTLRSLVELYDRSSKHKTI